MKRFVPQVPLFIDESLVVSSVGFDAATTAASMRAGISRTAPLPGFSVTADDGEEMDVNGHPISLLTHGFEGAGRYRQLLARLFSDARSLIAGGGWQKAGSSAAAPHDTKQVSHDYLLVGVPDASRYGQGMNVESGEPLRPEQSVFTLYGETWESLLDKVLLDAELADAFVARKVVELTPGRAPRLLQMAHEALRRDPAARVLVVTVDTLVDHPGLTWLYHTGRLKTAIYAAGTAPGECVNALLLSTRRNHTCQGRIDAVYHDAEEHEAHDARPPSGRALSRLLLSHLGNESATGSAGAGSSSAEDAWFICNLSGEQKPSFEWGMAQLHCQESGVDLAAMPWLPAIHVGEVGVSFMNLALAWAGQAFRRGYALAPRCGIALMDQSQNRALVSVSRA